jgi:hypothetical protein
LDEPIGLAVPLVALVIVLLAPQMPDMFAGIEGWVRPFFFAFSVTLLGFSAWYWTRAALDARYEVSDAERHKDLKSLRHQKEPDTQRRRCSPAEKWSLEWAPRMALLFSGMIITLAPLWIASSSEGHWHDVPWRAVIPGFCFIIGLFLFIHYRHSLNCYSHREPPEWMWRWRPTAVIAAAPFGWRVAVGLLILSGLSAWILATHHAWFGYIFSNWPSSWPAGPDKVFYTPTAAFFALGLVIPLLVIALALLRSVASLLLPMVLTLLPALIVSLLLNVAGRLPLRPVRQLEDWLWRLWERTRPHLHADQQRSPKPVDDALFARISSVLGLLLLVIIFLSPLTGEAENRYQVRTVCSENTDCPEKIKLNEPFDACETIDDGTESGDGGRPTGNGLRRPCIDEAVKDWYRAKVAGHPKNRKIPMIIVAAEGGGSRAAVWMLSAMKLLDAETKGDFGRYLFAISGVSGGSLGAVTYLQALRQYSRPEGGLNWDAGEVCKGLQALAEGDLLTASIATFFLNDPLGHLFGGLWNVDDRGIVLEKTFERYWQSEDGLKIPPKQAKEGFVALRANNPGLPHLLLNGTDKDTGRRVITSTIRFHPGDDLFAASDDLLAILKNDVFASTAVTNSARFPYISPPGRFKDRQVLDGGYFENYGVRTATELSRKIKEISDKAENDNDLKHKLEPIVIVISNDANAPRSLEDKKMVKEEAPITCPPSKVRAEIEGMIENAPAGTPEALEKRGSGIAGNALVPLLGLYATRGAHSQDALHILRRNHCSADGLSDRMIHIALPKPDPKEGEAAPLNWVLNKDAATFLLDEAPDIPFNQEQAQKLDDILEAVLNLPGGSEPGARQSAQAQQEQ